MLANNNHFLKVDDFPANVNFLLDYLLFVGHNEFVVLLNDQALDNVELNLKPVVVSLHVPSPSGQKQLLERVSLQIRQIIGKPGVVQQIFLLDGFLYHRLLRFQNYWYRMLQLFFDRLILLRRHSLGAILGKVLLKDLMVAFNEVFKLAAVVQLV